MHSARKNINVEAYNKKGLTHSRTPCTHHVTSQKPARLTRRAALAAAGAGAATALGALLTPAQATTYRPTVRRTPYNRYYSDRYGRRTRIVISDYYGSSYSHYYYYGG